MKRVALGVLLVVLCGLAGLWWLGRPYLIRLLQPTLEGVITRATGRPSRLQSLTVSLFPPAMHIEGLVIGTEAPLAQVSHADIGLSALASIEDLRPVVALRVASVVIDATQVPPKPKEPAKESAVTVPPLRAQIDLSNAEVRFRLGKSVATLTVTHLAGHAAIASAAAIDAGVDVSGVGLQRKSYHVDIDQIHAEGGTDAGGVFVRNATVKGERIAATVEGTAPSHRHTVSVSFDPGVLGVLVDELSVLSGAARLQGTLDGDLANPRLDGTLSIRQAAIAAHTLGDLDTHVTHGGTRLDFDDLRLAGTRGGEVTGAVGLNINKEVPLDGTLSWQGIDLARLLEAIGVPVPFVDRFDATTDVHGVLDPLDLDVNCTGTLRVQAQGPEQRVADWQIGGRVRPHALDARLELVQPERNYLSVQFLLDDHKLGGTASLQAANLAALNTVLPRPASDLAITGSADVSATFSGTSEHPEIGGTATMHGLTVVGTAVPRLSGDFSIAAGTLTTQSTKVQTASGNVEFSGILALNDRASNDWQVSLRDLSTDLSMSVARGFGAAVSPLVNGGTVTGTLRARGPWARMDTQGALTARDLHIGNEPLDRVDVTIGVTLPAWTLQMTAIHSGGESLNLDASGNGWKGLDVTLDSTPTDLSKWRGANRRHIVGTLEVHGHMMGDLQQPDGWLELIGTDLGARDHQLGDVRLRADGRGGEWTVHGQAYGHTIEVAGALRTTGPMPYRLAVTWREPDLSPFIGGEGNVQLLTNGELLLNGSLRAMRLPSGTLNVSELVIARGGYRMAAPEPVRVDVDGGRFRIRTFLLENEGGRLTASGEWSMDGHVNLEVQGSSDLSFLEFLGPPVYSARGQVTVVAHVGRSPGSGVQLSGEITLREAVLDADLPLTFTDVNGNMTLRGGQIFIEHFTGRAGGGEFTIGGAIDVNHGPAVSWSAKDVALSVPEWLEERVSGQGNISGTWRALTVHGDIEVLNALYDRRIELGDLVPFFQQQLAPAPRAGAQAVTVNLDLHIHATGGLFVDNNLAKVELAGDLRIGGTVAQPQLSGTLVFIDGEVTFRKRIFTITAGSIDFRDPFKINPVLNISAESQINTSDGEYTVTIVVTGTANDPRVILGADDPSLTQNDILSLITAGKTTAQLQREGGGIGFTDVLSVISTGAVESPARNLLNVDTFEVTSMSDHATGAIEPRVVLGKNLTDNLRTEVSTSFGVQTRPKVELEYRLTRRISLLGSWASDSSSQAGVFGGELRFRYEFRRVPFSLLDSLVSSAAFQPDTP